MDLRAIVRDRMAELGLTQAKLGRLLAPRLDISFDAAVRKLRRWLNREAAGDMTTDDFAVLLGALGLEVRPVPEGT